MRLIITYKILLILRRSWRWGSWWSYRFLLRQCSMLFSILWRLWQIKFLNSWWSSFIHKRRVLFNTILITNLLKISPAGITQMNRVFFFLSPLRVLLWWLWFFAMNWCFRPSCKLFSFFHLIHSKLFHFNLLSLL